MSTSESALLARWHNRYPRPARDNIYQSVVEVIKPRTQQRQHPPTTPASPNNASITMPSMRLRRLVLFAIPLHVSNALPPSHDQTPPAPVSTRILDSVDAAAFAATARSANGNDNCTATIVSDAEGGGSHLAFPKATIVHQATGTIDCLAHLPLVPSLTGYSFSVDWVEISGGLKLEPGALMERMNISVTYSGGGTQADVATARNLYGRGETGYDGLFNLSMPVVPGGGGQGLGTTTCRASKADPQSWLSVELLVSLVHEMTGFDDNTPHYGSIGGDLPNSWLKLGLEGIWQQC